MILKPIIVSFNMISTKTTIFATFHGTACLEGCLNLANRLLSVLKEYYYNKCIRQKGSHHVVILFG